MIEKVYNYTLEKVLQETLILKAIKSNKNINTTTITTSLNALFHSQSKI